MNRRNRRPGLQQLVCVLFIVLETLLALCVFIFEQEHQPQYLMILVTAVSTIVFSVVVTVLPDISDTMHSHMFSLMGHVAIIIYAIGTDNPSYVHYGIIITTLLSCIYEETRILRIQIVAGAIVYLAMGFHAGFHSLTEPGTLGRYCWTAGFVIFAQFILLFLVGHVARCKQVINENSKSSQDMLRVVEIKRKQAQAADHAKSLFLSNMSHEIRTPINAILGMDEIILRDSNEANVIEYAGKIQNAGNTLLSLINDILDFSKIESGRMEIIPENYKTEDLFNDVYDLICLRTEDKGLQLSFDIAENLPSEMRGDALRIKQILINVLNNSVKYTEKGSITLKVDWEPADESTAKLFVAIRDTGIGIRKEDQERVFDSFERLEANRNRHIEGTGLGMSITRSLVNMMQGSIHLESEYGQGTVFNIELLQEIVNESGMGEFKPKNTFINPKEFRKCEFVAPKASALVVDDNDMNLMVVKGLLKNCAIQTDLAKSGMECLGMVKQKHYDMIFMDHMMPEMDGIETFERMKSLEGNRCADTPVIVLTANAILGSKEMYMKHGFRDYLSKPVHSYQLEETLQKYLPQNLVEFVNKEPKEEITDLPEVPGLVFATGLSFASNDPEQYHANMRMFINVAQEKKNLMEELIRDEDWDRFAVEAHALKSNARYIGAMNFGDLCLRMEQAGKALQGSYIKDNWEQLKNTWEQLLEAVRGYLGPEVETEMESKNLPIDDEIYRRKLDKILEALQGYEIDEATERLHDLLDYELGERRRNVIKKALEEAENFNYKHAVERISGEII